MHLHLDLVFYLVISALVVLGVFPSIAFSDRLDRLRPAWAKPLILLLTSGVVLYGYYAFIAWYMSRVTEAEDFEPLVQAIDSGDLQRVKSLIPRNASVSANGEAALVEAARRGQVEIVRELLDRGVDVNVREGWHLEDVRTDCCVFVIIGYQPGDPPPPPPDTVVRVPRRGSISTAEGNLNDRVSTPLIEAASNGHVGVVRLLLERGADVNESDEHGSTALMRTMGVAAASDATRLLLDNGADVDARDQNGDTALTCAVRAATPSGVVRLLVDRGADVNATNESGRTPLLVAVKDGNTTLENVELLLDKGADSSARDENGFTPLMYAVPVSGSDITQAEFRLACARLLLSRGADVHGVKEGDIQQFRYAIQHHEEWRRNMQRGFWLLACERNYMSQADETPSQSLSAKAYRYCSDQPEQVLENSPDEISEHH